LTRAKQVLRSINVEIKGLAAPEASEWGEKAKKYEEQIGKFNHDIEWAENTTTQQGSADQSSKKKSTIYFNGRYLSLV
jgi:hypothetical protein